MLETLVNILQRVLNSSLLSTFLLAVRAVTPLIALYVIWRAYTSFRKGQRRKDPVIMLEDAATGTHFPVLYWENSIGRSRSCDIQIPDNSVSRDHAVLMRREEGWFICDTGSHLGTRVRGRILRNATESPQKKRSIFTGFSKEAASPFKLMLCVTLVHLSMTLQLMLGTGEFRLFPLAPFGILFLAGWGLYFFSRRILKRVSFEIETVALLLSSIGILLLSGQGLDAVQTQIAAMILGIFLFCFLVWFLSDLDRVMKARLYIAIGAILLFVLNILIGTEYYGSKNWIVIGPISIQPSELIKIAFVFVGASTLDHLQTKKNITEFIVFAGACLGFLVLMKDMGTALIFFATFLIIAFMRSGSFRTIFLILAAAIFAVLLVIQFLPHVTQRFAGWLHVWESPNDLGYQQTRTLTYIASGGLFGMGIGNGYLKYMPASDSDLVFGMLCEEQGLLMALVVQRRDAQPFHVLRDRRLRHGRPASVPDLPQHLRPDRRAAVYRRHAAVHQLGRHEHPLRLGADGVPQGLRRAHLRRQARQPPAPRGGEQLHAAARKRRPQAVARRIDGRHRPHRLQRAQRALRADRPNCAAQHRFPPAHGGAHPRRKALAGQWPAHVPKGG